MGIHTRLGCTWVIAMSALFGVTGQAQEPEIGPIGTGLAQSLGLNQNVAVVMCEYLGDETPFLRPDATAASGQVEIASAEQFVEIMEGPVNAYYLAATRQPSDGQGVTSFAFIPVPGKCQFDFANNGVFDDPQTMANEFFQGAKFADEALPGVFETTSRVIVVVNGSKRARATWAHWPFVLPNSGLRMLRAAVVGTDEVAEADFSTIAHELGHQLGLPDLYQLDGQPGRLVGQWGEMAQDRLQHFTAYSRYMANWIEDRSNRVVTITPSTVPAGPIRLDVPGNTNGNPELIRIDASSMEASPLPSPISDAIGLFVPFIGYYVEFRNPQPTNLDAPIAASYASGMLVFRHIDWLNTETGFSPRPLALMHPTQTSPLITPATAAFPVGVPFVDPAMGLTVTPVAANADGSVSVVVTWNPPPRPDIVITDLQLDSPVNGLGTFVEPLLFGDPLMTTATLTLTSLPPTLNAVTPPHTMRVSLRNIGIGANPPGMTGALWLLEPTIPVPFNLTNPSSLLPFRGASIPFTIPVMPSGGVATLLLTVTPTDAFLAVALIDANSAETDLQLLNNAYAEAFLEVPVLSFASPYPALEIAQSVTNADDRTHLIAFSLDLPRPLPEGWSLAVMENARMHLERGEKGLFKLVLEPPSPDVLKPGQVGTLATTAWMDEGDSFVPVMNVPRHFMLTATTAISLEADGGDGKYELSGELVQISDGAVVDQLGGQRVNLTIARSSGTDILLAVETDQDGVYRSQFQVEAEDQLHAAVAQFPGSNQFAESLSEPVVFHEPAAQAASPSLADLRAVWREGRLFLIAELSRAARDAVTLQVESSDARVAKAPPIEIAARKVSGTTEVVFASGARPTSRLAFRVTFGGQTRSIRISRVRPGAFSDLLRDR